MKKFILSFICLLPLCSLYAQDENPFAKYGYDVKVVTLTNGRFPEFHDRDKVVQIGSVLFNTDSMTITGDVEIDTTAMWLDAHTVSRWISPDPLAEKYYHISPYAYCANNPIKYIDPDGRKIVIILGRNESGQISQSLEYKQSKLYNLNGAEYNGNDAFGVNVGETLNNLMKVEDNKDNFVQKVVSTLENSDKTHYIENDPYGSNRARSLDYNEAEKGNPTGSHVIVTLDANSEGGGDTPETNLGHELSHSYDYDQGNNKGQTSIPPSSKSPTEIRAVNFENRIRNFFKMELLTTYGGRPINPNQLEDVKKK
ncbi:MAG: hypothetical protein LBQ60_01060 [Bacteroidales bacterium]|jgi:hypothetical protein|nr:hypothetical protein [Bacteroidales bacterium]